MIKSIIASLAMSLLAATASAENLSTVVMENKMTEKPNFVFSNTSVDGLLTLVGPGYDQARQLLLQDYWDGVSLDNKSKEILGLNRDEEELIVSVNNQVWLNNQFSFLPQYVQALWSRFGIEPQQMDVSDPDQVAKDVNQWASDNTNELIKNVLKPEQVQNDLVSILANAVYFKGAWASQFDKADTVAGPFAGLNDSVPMMTKEMKVNEEGWPEKVPVKITVSDKQDVLIVELPFIGESHSFVMAMPVKETPVNGPWYVDFSYDSEGPEVTEVFRNQIADGQAFVTLESRGYEEAFELFQMPKFEVESEIKGIEKMLSGLEMRALFDKGALSNMVDDPKAQLSKVFQKAKIIINEEGGEAAAVTVGMVTTESMSKTYRNLKIDGPFAFAIRDNETNVTLFEGIVTDPK